MFKHIKANSIIIAKEEVHHTIREELIKNNQYLGIKIYTINQFLNSLGNFQSEDSIQILFNYRKRLEVLKPSLHIYDKSVLSYEFMNACHNFIEEMKLYQVDVDDLAKDSEASLEMIEIIKTLYDYPTNNDATNYYLNKINELDASNIYIYPSFYTYNEQFYLDKLLAQGANNLVINTTRVEAKCFHALNKREEVEGCIQFIIEKKIKAQDIQLTLADVNYLPLVKQILERYNIPYTSYCLEMEIEVTQIRLLALLRYYLNPTQDQLMNCLSSGVFPGKYTSRLEEYLTIFEADLHDDFIHLQDKVNESNIMSDNDFKQVQTLQQQAKIARDEIVVILDELLEMDIKEALQKMIDLVALSLRNIREKQILNKIVKRIALIYDSLKTKDDLRYLESIMENSAVYSSIDTYQGLSITSINQSSLNKKYHFVLGVDNKNYPGFKSKNGIFDEEYYAKTPLPTQQQRYECYMQQLTVLMQASAYSYVSYSIAGYDGKGKELALEIETEYQHSYPYPLNQNYHPYKIEPKIDEKSAMQLYCKDGFLPGSISSLEKYIGCPYAYFLRYGLKIKEPLKLGFPQSYAGTLSHYVLEQLTTTYHKQYSEVNREVMDELIESELNKLIEVYPNYQSRFNTLKRRISNSLWKTLQRLAHYEQHSLAKPYIAEKEFYITYELEKVTLKLHGFVDRIDQIGSHLVIFDYKSSAKNLSMSKLKTGEQLQLVTYSVALANESQQKVIGSFYISLKNEDVAQAAYKVDRRKKETIALDEEELAKQIAQTHRFSGWGYDEEVACLDESNSHFKGFSITTKGSITKLQDLKALEDDLKIIFAKICNNILSGNIDINPSNSACMFCEYHNICHYRGKYNERIALIEDEEGDVDGEME